MNAREIMLKYPERVNKAIRELSISLNTGAGIPQEDMRRMINGEEINGLTASITYENGRVELYVYKGSELYRGYSC